jgi:polar amino acid transport system substrate-binding protein
MRNRNLFVLIAVVVLLSLALSACSSAGSANQTVRIATDATWPPFEYVDEGSKEIIGFDIDLIKAIAADQNINIEIVPVEWDALLAGVSQCQYDAAISAMTITPERAETMLFTDPYINAGQIVAVRADNTTIQGPADLVGVVSGAQIGTTGAIEIENIEGAELKTYDTVDLAYLDLINGQIDAVVADYPTAVNFVSQSNGQLITVGEVFTDESYGIAVCNKNAELRDKLNAGLNAVMSQGLIGELEAKWLAVSE